MNDYMVEKLFDGCLYAERLPIGLVDVIKNASPGTIRNFYKKWYSEYGRDQPKRIYLNLNRRLQCVIRWL